MKDKIRWGILGAAKIALRDVIPAMQKGEFCRVEAIASRNLNKAKNAAQRLHIPKFYGSYEELIEDAEIDAVYIPLPNHLHLEWAARAAAAGKHVLCEKPLGMNAEEVQKLIEVRNRTGVKIQEAFMVRTHPLWTRVKELTSAGRIGKIKLISGFFSYFNDDKTDIRNNADYGGGALLDIGCYCINFARFIFEDEPKQVTGVIERDSQSGIDSLTSAVLEFSGGQSVFSCSTQLVRYQRMQIFGTQGRIEVEIPFNIPAASPSRILLDKGSAPDGRQIEEIKIEAADKFMIQGDLFSQAILQETEQAVSLEDSYKNMAVIDAVFRSAESGKREVPRFI